MNENSVMDDLASAACTLLMSHKSTVRAACLRTSMLEGLISRYPTNLRVLKALLKLVSVKTGFIAVSQHTSALMPALLSPEDSIAAAAATLLSRLPISLHLRPDIPSRP